MNTKRKELRHDRHTVSLHTDHIVFSPKYRGKILVGDIAMVAEAIIQNTCKELNIEVIDMAVNPDHVHLFIKYLPKYSISYIAKTLKRGSSRILREEFLHLKEWCGNHLRVPSCYHGSVGNGWDIVESIFQHMIHTNTIGNNHENSIHASYICAGYTVTK